jgi:hypothetical protein
MALLNKRFKRDQKGKSFSSFESTRGVKKQQMRWTPREAHLLLQMQTKMLNDNLESTFRQRYPSCRRVLLHHPRLLNGLPFAGSLGSG